MSGTIYLFRHIPDMRRGETRNVGVALHARGQVDAMFVGETEPGEVDGRRVRSQVSDFGAYADWVHFWRHHLDSGQEGLAQLLDARAQRPDFVIAKAGEVVLDDDADPLFTVENLYADLVERRGPDPDTVKAQRLSSRAFELLHEAGIDRRDGFQRRIPVTDRNVPSVRHMFPFGVRNGRLTVGASVALDAMAAVERYSFRFGQAPRGARRVCLVRHGQRDDDRAVFLDGVTDVMVDVDADDAVDRVREAFAN